MLRRLAVAGLTAAAALCSVWSHSSSDSGDALPGAIDAAIAAMRLGSDSAAADLAVRLNVVLSAAGAVPSQADIVRFAAYEAWSHPDTWLRPNLVQPALDAFAVIVAGLREAGVHLPASIVSQPEEFLDSEVEAERSAARLVVDMQSLLALTALYVGHRPITGDARPPNALLRHERLRIRPGDPIPFAHLQFSVLEYEDQVAMRISPSAYAHRPAPAVAQWATGKPSPRSSSDEMETEDVDNGDNVVPFDMPRADREVRRGGLINDADLGLTGGLNSEKYHNADAKSSLKYSHSQSTERLQAVPSFDDSWSGTDGDNQHISTPNSGLFDYATDGLMRVSSHMAHSPISASLRSQRSFGSSSWRSHRSYKKSSSIYIDDSSNDPLASPLLDKNSTKPVSPQSIQQRMKPSHSDSQLSDMQWRSAKMSSVSQRKRQEPASQQKAVLQRIKGTFKEEPMHRISSRLMRHQSSKSIISSANESPDKPVLDKKEQHHDDVIKHHESNFYASAWQRFSMHYNDPEDQTVNYGFLYDYELRHILCILGVDPAAAQHIAATVGTVNLQYAGLSLSMVASVFAAYRIWPEGYDLNSHMAAPSTLANIFAPNVFVEWVMVVDPSLRFNFRSLALQIAAVGIENTHATTVPAGWLHFIASHTSTPRLSGSSYAMFVRHSRPGMLSMLRNLLLYVTSDVAPASQGMSSHVAHLYGLYMRVRSAMEHGLRLVNTELNPSTKVGPEDMEALADDLRFTRWNILASFYAFETGVSRFCKYQELKNKHFLVSSLHTDPVPPSPASSLPWSSRSADKQIYLQSLRFANTFGTSNLLAFFSVYETYHTYWRPTRSTAKYQTSLNLVTMLDLLFCNTSGNSGEWRIIPLKHLSTQKSLYKMLSAFFVMGMLSFSSAAQLVLYSHTVLSNAITPKLLDFVLSNVGIHSEARAHVQAAVSAIGIQSHMAAHTTVLLMLAAYFFGAHSGWTNRFANIKLGLSRSTIYWQLKMDAETYLRHIAKKGGAITLPILYALLAAYGNNAQPFPKDVLGYVSFERPEAGHTSELPPVEANSAVTLPRMAHAMMYPVIYGDEPATGAQVLERLASFGYAQSIISELRARWCPSEHCSLIVSPSAMNDGLMEMLDYVDGGQLQFALAEIILNGRRQRERHLAQTIAEPKVPPTEVLEFAEEEKDTRPHMVDQSTQTEAQHGDLALEDMDTKSDENDVVATVERLFKNFDDAK